MPSQKLLYTIPEVMDRLQVSRWMVYELIHRRELASVTIGRCRRASARALSEYLARVPRTLGFATSSSQYFR